MKSAVMHHCKNHCIVLRLAITNIGKRIIAAFEEIMMFLLFRLILRCRQLARERFAKMRADVLVKLELLDQKHGLFITNIYFFDRYLSL